MVTLCCLRLLVCPVESKHSKNPYQIPLFPSRPRTPPSLFHHCILHHHHTMLSISIFLVLLTNLLHLTLAHISKVDSHGHSFYGTRNLTAIHHANFLSSTPSPRRRRRRSHRGRDLKHDHFRAPRRPQRPPPLLHYLRRHLCLLAARMVRILPLVNVDRRPMLQQPEFGRAYLLRTRYEYSVYGCLVE
jgi:hypothetical protein